MKTPPSLCPNAGFTLLETMLALGVLSISLLALAGLQVTAIRGNILSQNITTAVSVAEKKIEELKNTPYANIAAESATQVSASNMNFTQQVTVTNNSPLTNTKTVSVLVTWKDKAKTHTVPITVIIAKPLGG